MLQSHAGIHTEVNKLADKIAEATAQRPASTDKAPMIDKVLMPDKFHGAPEEWRQWSCKFMNCLEKPYPGTEKAMEGCNFEDGATLRG